MSTTVIIKKTKKSQSTKETNKSDHIYGVYMKSVLERKVCLDITEIGDVQTLDQRVSISEFRASVTAFLTLVSFHYQKVQT